jgi:hypothetical protein
VDAYEIKEADEIKDQVLVKYEGDWAILGLAIGENGKLRCELAEFKEQYSTNI